MRVPHLDKHGSVQRMETFIPQLWLGPNPFSLSDLLLVLHWVVAKLHKPCWGWHNRPRNLPHDPLHLLYKQNLLLGYLPTQRRDPEGIGSCDMNRNANCPTAPIRRWELALLSAGDRKGEASSCWKCMDLEISWKLGAFTSSALTLCEENSLSMAARTTTGTVWRPIPLARKHLFPSDLTGIGPVGALGESKELPLGRCCRTMRGS